MLCFYLGRPDLSLQLVEQVVFSLEQSIVVKVFNIGVEITIIIAIYHHIKML